MEMSFSYVVVGDQNTDAAVLEEANDALNLNHGDWVDTCKRFVEQNEARISSQCTCDFRAATFAARKREGSVGADVLNLQLVEKIVEALFDFGARQPGACLIVLQLQNGADVILDCQLAKDACFLRQVGHAQAGSLENRQMRDRIVV